MLELALPLFNGQSIGFEVLFFSPLLAVTPEAVSVCMLERGPGAAADGTVDWRLGHQDTRDLCSSPSPSAQHQG